MLTMHQKISEALKQNREPIDFVMHFYHLMNNIDLMNESKSLRL